MSNFLLAFRRITVLARRGPLPGASRHRSGITLLILMTAFFFMNQDLRAQFTKVDVGLPNLQESAVAWGDFNNDGFLDLVVSGTTDSTNGDIDNSKFLTRIYKNNGNGTFTDIQAGIPSMWVSTVAWGDYDNDGYLDLVVGGDDSLGNQVTKLYHNNSGTNFTEVTGSAFPQGVHSSSYGSATWGDFNNDGYLDLLITGYDAGGPVTKLYKNNGNGTFSEVLTAVLQGVNGHSRAAWGDYDNDGYLDIVICGRTTTDSHNPQPATKLYHNNGGNGTFTLVAAANFVGVWRGTVAWGDFNNDGYLDLFVAGQTTGVDSTGFTSRDTTLLYQNNGGNGTFTALGNSGILAGAQSSAAWGDYDGDGLLDILTSGYGSDAGLYHNNGDGTFSAPALGPPSVANGCVAWGDFNGDGYLDALVTGVVGGSVRDSTILYRYSGVGSSSSFTANTKPNAPTGLTATVNGSEATLSWAKATDGKTPQNGLTYNLRIGSTSHGIQRLSPLADTASGTSNGFRRVVRMGGANEVTSWKLQGLKIGNYYWSVQAVDNAFAGSSFSAENYFSVPDTVNANVKVYLQGPYVASGDSMANGLRVGGYLATHFTGRAIPALAVDSINIEIRDSSAVAKANKRRFAPAWLLTGGTIRSFVDTTKSYVSFDSVYAAKWYIVVRHRNHLAIMSSAPDSMNALPNPAAYDFSTGQAAAWGTNAMQPLGTKFGLIAGNANGDGAIDGADRNIWRVQNGDIGYLNGDFDLSGGVIGADRNIWRVNNGALSRVP